MTLATEVDGRSGLDRLRRVSAIARGLGYLAAALTVVGMVWLWRDPENLAAHARGTIGITGAVFAPSARGYWAALALGTIPAGLFIAAMLSLAGLFGRFGQGRVMERDNALRLGRIGWLFVALGLSGPIARALQSVALTFDNPPGQGQLAIALDTGSFGALAAGVAFVGLGIVFQEAVRLSDENQSFV